MNIPHSCSSWCALFIALLIMGLPEHSESFSLTYSHLGSSQGARTLTCTGDGRCTAENNARSKLSPLSLGSQSSLAQHSQSNSRLYNAMPHDDMFYDGYEVFIQNLQADLEDKSHDIYETKNADGASDVQESKSDQGQDQGQGQGQQRTNQHRHRGRNNDSNTGRGGPGRRNSRGNRHATNRRKPGYRRDPTDDMSIEVNEREISRLISLRSKAQRERNYIRADDIRDELNDVHGVYVWDKDGLWSVSPIAPSRRYRNYAVDDSTRNHPRDRNGKHHRQKQFGRNGHDYTQIGDDIDNTVCTLRLHEIHSLISKRLGHKLMKEFKKADEIQSQLYTNGVKIHDKRKQWRADGGIFDDVDGMVGMGGKPFKINEHSEEFEDDLLLEEIIEVVQVRDEARSIADYAEADRLRSVLWNMFRVAVDDKSRTFSLGGDFGPNGTFRWTDNGPINPRKGRSPSVSRDWRIVGGMYTKSELSEKINEKDEEEVYNLIHDRLEAKRVQDYEVSDLIQSHLYNEYRISVDDQLRQWSVGGAFDESSTRSLRQMSPTSIDGSSKSSHIRRYNRRGGTGHLSKKEISIVEAIVQRRSEEMARFNKEAAESLRNGLKKNYYVIIDDMNDEWHVRGNDFIISPVWEGRSLPKYVEESRQEIGNLIRERSQARREKDFTRADEIRLDLMETYNIKLDDRIKEWTIIDDGEEFINIDAAAETEATLSRFTVVQLKEKLNEIGLPRTGRKADLIQRILDH